MPFKDQILNNDRKNYYEVVHMTKLKFFKKNLFIFHKQIRNAIFIIEVVDITL